MIDNIDILDLIPQRRPFVMVDSLTECTAERAVTRFEVPTEGVLIERGCLTEAGLMENIAQTCAARIGYINLISGATVKLGVIGAVKDFEVNSLPASGRVLTTAVTVIGEFGPMLLVEAEVRCKELLVARCQMKISVTDIEMQK